MKSYCNKLMMYHEIHRMSREGFSHLRIGREMAVSRHTVKRYLSMSEDEYNLFLESQSNRKNELHCYEEFVKTRLSTYPDTPAAQLHDWLKEKGIAWSPIQNGKPQHNAIVERFNKTYREELLDAYLFESIAYAQHLTDNWVREYNTDRPHQALNYLTPVEYAA